MAGLGRGSAELVLLALALVAAASVATATTYQVGGEKVGVWTLPSASNGVDYQTWANSITFKFGDELVFNYQNDTHDVLLVNGTTFDTCNIAGDIEKWDSGEDVIELTFGYPVYYFMCGTPGHCDEGQKFQITVSAFAAPPVPGGVLPPSGSSRISPQIGILVFSAIAMVVCTILLS